MKYMSKMTEIWEKAAETGSYMKNMIHTLASGARGRGFESSKQDVWNAALYMDVHERSPHCPKVIFFESHCPTIVRIAKFSFGFIIL
jgi:hypothetical protein